MAHFFLFTSGEYEDYTVDDVYTCDKHITREDWDNFVKERENFRQEKFTEFKKAACKRVGVEYDEVCSSLNIYSTPEYYEYAKWCAEQESDGEMFRRFHNMVKVDFVECYCE